MFNIIYQEVPLFWEGGREGGLESRWSPTHWVKYISRRLVQLIQQSFGRITNLTFKAKNEHSL